MEKEFKAATGLILGKFMPLHKGHCYLIETALRKVERLIVLVGSLKREPIPGRLRYHWVREMFPQAKVYHLTDENPQEPHEHPDFWNIWVRSIRKFCPQGPDLVFTSESYGDELARRLGAGHYPVDIDRKTFPVSGTNVRMDPFGNWEYLPQAVRPYFVKKIVIYGPESTGKTTLAQQLAEHYDTAWIPEYARGMLDEKGIEDTMEETVELSDIDKIGRGQLALEAEGVKRANKILFCDSDLNTTAIYSHHFCKACPRWIEQVARTRHYDLFLLSDIDLPWHPDPQRDTGERREEFFNRFKEKLDQQKRPYRMVSGLGEKRLRNAVRMVDEWLGGLRGLMPPAGVTDPNPKTSLLRSFSKS